MIRLAVAAACVALTACAPAAQPSPPTSPPSAAPPPATDDASVRALGSLVPVVRVKGEPVSRHALADRMERFHVPGVSIAVARHGVIAWARGVGVRERGSSAAVTPTTLFQAASISKVMAATATLRLAEQQRVAIDEDVNRYLRTWKVPDNEFTRTEKVTLRRIVSHTAGLNLHGFMGYPSGAPLPTTAQILDGVAPANTAPIRVEAAPGTKLAYSGGGVMIEQLVLTDVTGEPFPALAKRLVFEPAGMQSSTFALPLAPADAARASSAHDADGTPLPGRFVVYPEAAAAGLWSTPTDLCAWAMAIADGRSGKSSRLLSKPWAEAMLTRQMGPLGLGPVVRGEGKALRFGHAGWNEGAHAEILYYPELDEGAAVMVNGAAGRPLLREILYALAAEYGWPGLEPDAIEAVPIDPAVRDALPGTYEGKADGVTVDGRFVREGDGLRFVSKKLGVSSDVIFVADAKLVVRDSGDELAFARGAGGAIDAVSYGELVLARKR